MGCTNSKAVEATIEPSAPGSATTEESNHHQRQQQQQSCYSAKEETHTSSRNNNHSHSRDGASSSVQQSSSVKSRKSALSSSNHSSRGGRRNKKQSRRSSPEEEPRHDHRHPPFQQQQQPSTALSPTTSTTTSTTTKNKEHDATIWQALWTKHESHLLDPVDVPSAWKELLHKSANQLTPVEWTFCQRKIRATVQSHLTSSAVLEKKRGGPLLSRSSMMMNMNQNGNHNNNNNHNNKPVPSHWIAERFHLLAPPICQHLWNPHHLSLFPSFYALLVSTSCITDRTTWLAQASATEASLVTDVNLLYSMNAEKEEDAATTRATTTIPPPPQPMRVGKREGLPPLDHPPGVRPIALASLLGMALRGTRRQRLQLLFFILMDATELETLLKHHPAGGVPLWLWELDSEVVFGLGSLSHSYWYGSIDAKGVLDDQEDGIYINGKKTMSVLGSIFEIRNHETTGEMDGSGHRANGHSSFTSPPPLSPPQKKERTSAIDAMRRRASFNSPKETTISTTGASVNSNSTPTTHEDDGAVSFASHPRKTQRTDLLARIATTPFSITDYCDNDDDRGESVWRPSAALPDRCSLMEFARFAESSLSDCHLEAIFQNLILHNLLPSPSLELDLVKSRWLEWEQERKRIPHGPSLVVNGDAKGVSSPSEKTKRGKSNHGTTSAMTPFGGFDGWDGQGGAGFGTMYCLDKVWWDQWTSYVGWAWAGKQGDPPRRPGGGTNRKNRTNRTRRSKKPGTLSTESLLDKRIGSFVAGSSGSYELMKGSLILNRDYVLIPPVVWDILYELYAGGPPLPRMVLPPNGDGNKSFMDDDRSNGVEVQLTMTDDDDSVPKNHDPIDHAYPMRLSRTMRVATHPWILHVHLCDSKQPYRRGDVGPLSIRVMVLPDQPISRFLGELASRLPFANNSGTFSATTHKGQARLWKRVDLTPTPKGPATPYGPWVLLCKGRVALVPKFGMADVDSKQTDEIKESWRAFADNGTIEDIGIKDGDQLMVESAVVSRTGEFLWPREAAAKAGKVRLLADQDMKFRRMLRNLDATGKPMSPPVKLIGLEVDAMDSSGRWYQVAIQQAQVSAVDTDEEEDSTEQDSLDGSKDNDERLQVRVDFSQNGGHLEWIDVDSDRLAAAGRYTLNRADSQEVNGKSPPNNSTPKTTAKQKPHQAQIKKANHTDTDNGKVCTVPGFGACGLANLGNTCYANSAIQCISYLPLLRAYLVSAQYKSAGDLNRDNPLGTGGKLLEEFADLLRQMWSAKLGEKSPSKLKLHLGRANSQFSGADQQDAQEFLSFMLDVLHEDSNRIMKKPYVEGLEDSWVTKNALPRVGVESWRRFLRRNDSIMTDVGMGQVLSTVTCPVCKFSSRNFDPFNLVSIPFPTVADILFRVVLVRRATAANTHWVLNKPRQGENSRGRYTQRELQGDTKSSTPKLVFEQHIIPMSRLADSGDLRLQIHNISGIPMTRFRLCKGEEEVLEGNDTDTVSPVQRRIHVTPLTDKEGPCSQLAKPKTTNEDGTPIDPMAMTTLIVAFESTIRSRPPQRSSSKDQESASSQTSQQDDESIQSGSLSKFELDELGRDVTLYGNAEECRLYDTDPLRISKEISRRSWPTNENDFHIGLRVDAIDHKENWFAGSVVEVIPGDENKQGGKEEEEQEPRTKVKVHFDNFSSRWDEIYTLENFTEGRVRPLFSHALPRAKPTEFMVHHRFTDHETRSAHLFGQTCYVQCLNEWTVARAGAQILAQATRFLQITSDLNVKNDKEAEKKVRRFYDRTQLIISEFIDTIIEYDRRYVHEALGLSDDSRGSGRTENGMHQEPPGKKSLDAAGLSAALMKRSNELQNRLPFEIKVCNIDSPLGGTGEELTFPFSLLRTIGNYMNSRHAIVLIWREVPSEKKSPGRYATYLRSPIMYTQGIPDIDEASQRHLETAQQKLAQTSAHQTSSGLPLGVCLSEFCKVQQLSLSDNWRCPKCRDFRAGKQSLSFWQLPDLLTIHIKRFNCSARWREKITTLVNFPLTGLDMQEWCHAESPASTTKQIGSEIYDLIGVLNHYGGMTGGHYVATCKATQCDRDGNEEVAFGFNGSPSSQAVEAEDVDQSSEQSSSSAWRIVGRQKPDVNSTQVLAAASAAKSVAESAEPLWLQFDDEIVEPIPPRRVVSEMAYVVFYRRRNMTTSNIASYSTLG